MRINSLTIKAVGWDVVVKANVGQGAEGGLCAVLVLSVQNDH